MSKPSSGGPKVVPDNKSKLSVLEKANLKRNDQIRTLCQRSQIFISFDLATKDNAFLEGLLNKVRDNDVSKHTNSLVNAEGQLSHNGVQIEWWVNIDDSDGDYLADSELILQIAD